MKNLRWKGGLIVAAAVIGFQWYVEANPVEPVKPVEDVKHETLTKMNSLNLSLPTTPVTEKVKVIKNWQYHFENDQLRHTIKEYGDNASQNKIKFAFPYDRDTWLHIMTVSGNLNMKKYKPHAPVREVYLTTNNGQFECGYDGCYASVSFDGGKVHRFHLEMINTYPNNVMYMTDGQAFIKEAKKHKNAIIEVDYFNNGSQQFMFSLHDEKLKSFSS
ncbi:hypothetical protein C1Y41_04565 [Pantoea sp. ICBG 1758]|uniref:hypothetical protein n=1 Tax=Pantoea sp. ICBG 1758 TaxID=2071682 RepID=UPI000CE43B14|nr:hypothetical protein [Pantoea sp. ICBG 1758]PPC63922.1 hypothetical protein C1Y41_04565 [Pantoea sp. ICBG 1758]